MLAMHMFQGVTSYTNVFFYFWQYLFLTRRLFKGSVGERGNKLNFNLGLGCQSSNWFYPDLMLLTFVWEATPWKIKFVYPFTNPLSQKKILPKIKKIIVISGKSMRVRPESVTHLVVKLFIVKSKFDYIDKNKILSRPNATYICMRGNTLKHVHS
jgi:hypothetical protein